MTLGRSVRWGILGTAKIARNLFLPSLREAGGDPAAVAGRDPGRTEQWAAANGVGRAITGYQDLVGDPDIDALYIPLPNALHGEWTILALEAGKPVLCEKPLTGSAVQTGRVLAVARETGTPLWEAFAFPFHDQMARLRGILADGTIGDLREIQSDFHFLMGDPQTNIRMFASLDGGALLDVGCYPVRLARDLFGAEHEGAWARAEFAPGGVDRGDLRLPGFPRRPPPLSVLRVRPGGRHLHPAARHRWPDPGHQPVPPSRPGHLRGLPGRPFPGDAPGHRALPAVLHSADPAHPGGDP